MYWFDSHDAKHPFRAGGGPDIDTLRRLHAMDPAPIPAILEHVNALGVGYPIYEVPTLSSWHRGAVVLVGDAAHAVGPHAGQGASMAIEDALVLFACLSREANQESAFVRYESLRRDRVATVARLTAKSRSRKHRAGWLARQLREQLLRLVIPASTRDSRKLFRFRADLAPLEPPPP